MLGCHPTRHGKGMRFSLINHKNETLHKIHHQNGRGEGVKLDVIYEVDICFICYWIGEYQLYDIRFTDARVSSDIF